MDIGSIVFTSCLIVFMLYVLFIDTLRFFRDRTEDLQRIKIRELQDEIKRLELLLQLKS